MGGSVRVKPLVSKYSCCGAHDGGADAQDGGLARRAHPEVAMLHQEVDAVLLERDGEGRLVGDALHDLDVVDVELEAGGRARVGADLAGDDDAGLQREVLERLEDLFGRRRPWARCPGWFRCRRGRWGRAACRRRGGCRASRAG